LIVAERVVIPANEPESSAAAGRRGDQFNRKTGFCIEARYKGIVLLRFLDAGSVIPDSIRDRHDEKVDFNQPILEPLVL